MLTVDKINLNFLNCNKSIDIFFNSLVAGSANGSAYLEKTYNLAGESHDQTYPEGTKLKPPGVCIPVGGFFYNVSVLLNVSNRPAYKH